MARATKIVDGSRNGNCPAVYTVDGDITTDQGETISNGMVLIQAYKISGDTETRRQIELAYGEDVLAAPEAMILQAADRIRAARG